ncbi:MAG TPA: septal ring lytic transglycosylase RlpA family protein [Geobacteraceae bacterium]
MAHSNPRGMLALILLFCQLFLLFPTLPLQAEQTQETEGSAQSVAPPTTEQHGVEGVASYYAKRYNGRRTHSGARYNPKKMTAAHPTLPLGTRVRVVNLANKREVIVTVNDRCRHRKHPFIDLSRAAAGKLGFLGRGIARVRIIPLDDDSSDT